MSILGRRVVLKHNELMELDSMLKDGRIEVLASGHYKPLGAPVYDTWEKVKAWYALAKYSRQELVFEDGRDFWGEYPTTNDPWVWN